MLVGVAVGVGVGVLVGMGVSPGLGVGVAVGVGVGVGVLVAVGVLVVGVLVGVATLSTSTSCSTVNSVVPPLTSSATTVPPSAEQAYSVKLRVLLLLLNFWVKANEPSSQSLSKPMS
ncbi:MAG: hypothetical protein F4X34_05930 [Chloroflexi bacterium]|nr:hypothetical protein [Chloroflexota bacterium]